MALAATFSNPKNVSDPMVELNTTPLIDIMLVLLIMFIITIPPQSHQVAVQLPSSGIPIDALKNEVGLDVGGQVRWNGGAVSDRQLRALLVEASTMASPPEIQFRPDAAARYERVDTVMAIAAQSGVKRFGFVGNEGYRDIF